MVTGSIEKALEKLKETGLKSTLLFHYGTMSFKIFKPEIEDTQQPHEQDEIYIVAKGKSIFYCDGETKEVSAGDFLFVPAGMEHRFLDFSNDFSTWVIFYGPKGGEKGCIQHES